MLSGKSSQKLDRLSGLLARFHLHGCVSHAGELQATADCSTRSNSGLCLYILLSGSVRLDRPGNPTHILEAPLIAVLTQATPHRLVPPTAAQPPHVVCAFIEFGVGEDNPVMMAFPECLFLPLEGTMPDLLASVELLAAEAAQPRCGRQTVLDRAIEILVIALLRHLMDRKLVTSGLLAGLSDPRLARALAAIHETPQHSWTLDTLAQRAGMSRTAFALTFRTTVGLTPGRYLVEWRLSLARSLLARGRTLKSIAGEVGYDSSAALSRALSRTRVRTD